MDRDFACPARSNSGRRATVKAFAVETSGLRPRTASFAVLVGLGHFQTSNAGDAAACATATSNGRLRFVLTLGQPFWAPRPVVVVRRLASVGQVSGAHMPRQPGSLEPSPPPTTEKVTVSHVDRLGSLARAGMSHERGRRLIRNVAQVLASSLRHRVGHPIPGVRL